MSIRRLMFGDPDASVESQHLDDRRRCNQMKVRSKKMAGIPRVTEGLQMANQTTRKCAHIPCLCDVRNGEEYCGDACRDAGGEDIEIACQCDHVSCPLTARWLAPGSAARMAES
jgi:hypothetical protein